VADKENWKQRYLDETREWDATLALLRKAVSRLAIVAEGSSSGMNRTLQRIQKHARAGADESLFVALEELSQQLRRRELEESAEGEDRDRLYGADPSLRDVLLSILDELAVAQPVAGAVDTLRDALRDDPDVNTARMLNRIISELRSIIQRISHDKQALQQLMQEVSQELGDITEVLAEDRSGLQDGHDQAMALHDIMDSGVQKIQGQLDTALDVDALKETVSHSLEGIRAGIADFLAKDVARLADAEARNQALQTRIGRMERETQHLQRKLNRNREKLMRDALTGARSRLAYDEEIAQELSRFRRYKEAFCLGVLDIDYFKRINDNFGHAAGDKALTLVASQLLERIRDTDQLFRVGGEEFVLLLPRTDLAGAEPLVESIRKAVGESGFHFEGEPTPITLSAGLTEVIAGDDAESLFARADDAMYRAKKAGRDRLVTIAV